MNPLDIILTALRSLGGSKLRSGLTLLGIIIGITAVTVLMSIGRGVQQNITSRIQSQGANLLFVQSTFGGSGHLTLEDAEALIDPVFAPSVKAVAPQISTNGTIVAGRENTSAQLIGITPDYAVVRNVSVGSGAVHQSGACAEQPGCGGSERVRIGHSFRNELLDRRR